MQIRDKSGKFISSGKIIFCDYCGVEIYRVEYRFKRSKKFFCSKECNAKFRKGFFAANWQGGKSFEEYGFDFDDNLKELIRFRDNYRCRMCGCPQIENKKQLDIHHIDYDKQNNVSDNLISLCKACHMKTNVKLENREKITIELKALINITFSVKEKNNNE